MSNPICRRVVIIGLDGAGNAVKDTEASNIQALFAQGAYTYHARTEFPSISAECWGALFHGAGFADHKIHHELINRRPCPEDLPCPSFMKAARQQMPGCVLASFCNWDPINVGIIEDSCNCIRRTAPDDELTGQITDYIRDNDFTILFVQFDDIDHYGHADGYWSDRYYRQVRKTDGNVARILEAIDRKGIREDTLVIACADHGGGGGGGAFTHGSDLPPDMTIFWGCRGPGVRRGGIAGDVWIADTAAVVAHALGLARPEGWTCKLPQGIFAE